MKVWKQAIWLVARQWGRWIVFASVLAGASGFAVIWLWTPLSTGWELFRNIAYLLSAGLFAAWGLTNVHRQFAPAGVRLFRSARRLEFWASVSVFTLAGVWLPVRLVHWVPAFETLAAQAWSAGVRFLLAWALFTGGICWLMACLGFLSKEEL